MTMPTKRSIPISIKLIAGIIVFMGMFVVAMVFGAAETSIKDVWFALTTSMEGEKLSLLREIRLPVRLRLFWSEPRLRSPAPSCRALPAIRWRIPACSALPAGRMRRLPSRWLSCRSPIILALWWPASSGGDRRRDGLWHRSHAKRRLLSLADGAGWLSRIRIPVRHR